VFHPGRRLNISFIFNNYLLYHLKFAGIDAKGSQAVDAQHPAHSFPTIIVTKDYEVRYDLAAGQLLMIFQAKCSAACHSLREASTGRLTSQGHSL
jgi:hypothetical protein